LFATGPAGAQIHGFLKSIKTDAVAGRLNSDRKIRENDFVSQTIAGSF
jgi:hypothetical protein